VKTCPGRPRRLIHINRASPQQFANKHGGKQRLRRHIYPHPSAAARETNAIAPEHERRKIRKN
jgi:hypothetical protein